VPHTAALGHLGDHARGHQIDLHRQLFIQRAGRVADNAAQVDDSVHVAHGFHHAVDLAEVGLDHLQVRVVEPLFDRLGAVEKQVEHTHPVALLKQVSQQSRADVARPADNQHVAHFTVFGALIQTALRAHHILPDRSPQTGGHQQEHGQQPGQDEGAGREVEHFFEKAQTDRAQQGALSDIAQQAENQISHTDRLNDDQHLVSAAVEAAVGVKTAQREDDQADQSQQPAAAAVSLQILPEGLLVIDDRIGVSDGDNVKQAHDQRGDDGDIDQNAVCNQPYNTFE